MTVFLSSLGLSGSSIDIKTLPPDLRRLALNPSGSFLMDPLPSLRSTISPEWNGDHSAVLDGDQGSHL